MKRLLIAMIAMIFVAACADIERPKEGEYCPPATVGLTRSQNTVAAGQVKFGIDFFRKASETEDGNMLVSPFSMSSVWSMASAAAGGDTYSEIAGTLGFNDCTAEEIGSYYAKAVEIMKPSDDSTKICLANSIWADEQYSLSENITGIADRYYSAKMANLDLMDPKSIEYINGWVKDRTDGMINGVLDDNSIGAQVIMINTLLFDARWRDDSYETAEGKFRSEDGTESNRSFFCGYGSGSRAYNLSESENQNPSEPQIISLPFASCPLEMIFILPPEGMSMSAFIADLNDGKWNRWMTSFEMKPGYVIFSIPKFEAETSLDQSCINILKELGIRHAFNDSACFPELPGMCVSRVSHKTIIEVSEVGAKAAAASSIELLPISAGIQPLGVFTADKPFLYAIVEPSTQSILFMGVVRK